MIKYFVCKIQNDFIKRIIVSELLKLENQLCHRFYTLSNAFTRAYRPLLKALDITYPQYVTLMALWESDNITIAELLDRTSIDGGAMSLILKKLEDKTYLRVVKDEQDKRVKRVCLTNTGKQKKPCCRRCTYADAMQITRHDPRRE